MASIILGMGFGLCSLSQAQMGGMGGGMGGGMPNIPGTEFRGATDPSLIRSVDGLRVLPSVQVSERYDSNVFFVPPSQLHGVNPEDVVTTVFPQVRALYADPEKLVKLNAVAGTVGSYYANNTGLSYVGANAGMALDMSDLLSRWRPGASWIVSDTFYYTPRPPAFLVGDQLGDQANPLVAGFQAPRATTTFNSVNTTFQFPLNQTVNLTGSYTYSFIRYGASPVPQGAFLISQNVRAYTAGLSQQVSLQDTVRVGFTGNEFDQGTLGVFSTRGGVLGWVHRFSPTISFDAIGGVQQVSGDSNGVEFPSMIAPQGTFALRWQDPATSIDLAYQSNIIPSLQLKGAAMLNHSVVFNMTQQTPIRDLVGLLRAGYSFANQYGSNSEGALSWTTVGGTAGLLYRVTQKLFLTLTYSYQHVDNVFGVAQFAYDRHVVQLSLTQGVY